jgi:hypothetical protein
VAEPIATFGPAGFSNEFSVYNLTIRQSYKGAAGNSSMLIGHFSPNASPFEDPPLTPGHDYFFFLIWNRPLSASLANMSVFWQTGGPEGAFDVSNGTVTSRMPDGFEPGAVHISNVPIAAFERMIHDDK